MPTRAELERELLRCGDELRHRYLKRLHEITKRDVILYASGFTSLKAGTVPPWTLSIGIQDVQCFMAALHGLKGRELDLVLHSPGGSLESAEQLVQYLRSKYDHIRAIIPQNAMSAATMIACACNEIVMGKQSALGPTDPQIIFESPRGQRRAVPAHAVISEYEQALNAIKGEPRLATFWAARFADYPPGLFHQCDQTIKGSKKRLEEWLIKGAASHVLDAEARRTVASNVVQCLGEPQKDHTSHGRPIAFDTALSLGLNITQLEKDPDLQDAVLSLYHAVSIKFDSTDCVKIVENHHGKGMHLRVQTKQQP